MNKTVLSDIETGKRLYPLVSREWSLYFSNIRLYIASKGISILKYYSSEESKEKELFEICEIVKQENYKKTLIASDIEHRFPEHFNDYFEKLLEINLQQLLKDSTYFLEDLMRSMENEKCYECGNSNITLYKTEDGKLICMKCILKPVVDKVIDLFEKLSSLS